MPENDQQDGTEQQQDGNGTGGTGSGAEQEQKQAVDENSPVDVSTLPANVQKLIREARSEAAGNRTKASSAEQKYATTLEGIAKALGLKGDDKPDPEKLAKELADKDSRLNATLAENAILRNAGKAKGDPEMLRDSTKFMTAVGKLDPTSDDYDAKVREAIAEAVKANPKLGIGQTVGAGGRDLSGGDGGSGSGSTEKTDIESMSQEDIQKLVRKARGKRG